MSELTHEEFQRLRPKMLNENEQSFRKFSEEDQIALNRIPISNRQYLSKFGWLTAIEVNIHPNYIYRVNPDYEGPAKPEPTPEFVDCEIYENLEEWWFKIPFGATHSFPITKAQGVKGFAGYVSEDGEVMTHLLFNVTCELIVPRAVRFRVVKKVG